MNKKIDIKQLHDKVIKAYSAQGFSSEVIGAWTISDNDVEDLVNLARNANPKRILEVGTYVGASTMLLALVCPDAIIHTVDPDFPLAVEMRATDNAVNVADDAPTHHTIAREAARILGVEDRIFFHAGGFSVSDTFASSMHADGPSTVVIGPELCEKEGPFDFVFIDALHTFNAVLKDLELVVEHITPNGQIVLHDCIGFWGSNVRAGIFEFLRQNREYGLLYRTYAELYKTVGVVKKRASMDKTIFREPGADWNKKPNTVGMLGTIAKTLLGNGNLLEIVHKKPLLKSKNNKRKLTALVSDFNSVIKLEKDVRAHLSIPENIGPDISGIFSAELADYADDKTLNHLLTVSAQQNLPLVLGMTPPGEYGVAGPQSRSLATIVEMARDAGSSVFCLPSLDLEPSRFPLLPEPRNLGLSSLFLAFVVIVPGEEFTDADGRNYTPLNLTRAIDREQTELQRVHVATSFRHYFETVEEAHANYVKEHDSRLEVVKNMTRQIEIEREYRLSQTEHLSQNLSSRISSLETTVDNQFKKQTQQSTNSFQSAQAERKNLFESSQKLSTQLNVTVDAQKKELDGLKAELQVLRGEIASAQATDAQARATQMAQLKSDMDEVAKAIRLEQTSNLEAANKGLAEMNLSLKALGDEIAVAQATDAQARAAQVAQLKSDMDEVAKAIRLEQTSNLEAANRGLAGMRQELKALGDEIAVAQDTDAQARATQIAQLKSDMDEVAGAIRSEQASNLEAANQGLAAMGKDLQIMRDEIASVQDAVFKDVNTQLSKLRNAYKAQQNATNKKIANTKLLIAEADTKLDEMIALHSNDMTALQSSIASLSSQITALSKTGEHEVSERKKLSGYMKAEFEDVRETFTQVAKTMNDQTLTHVNMQKELDEVQNSIPSYALKPVRGIEKIVGKAVRWIKGSNSKPQ